MGYLRAAKHFNVPRSTLLISNNKHSLIQWITNTVIGRMSLFGQDIENLLVKYVLTMESEFYALTRINLRHVAYKLALKIISKTILEVALLEDTGYKGALK